MKITNLPLSPAASILNSPTGQTAVASTTIKGEIPSAGQIIINKLITALLDQLAVNIKRQEELLAQLPEKIAAVVRSLLQQHLSTDKSVAQGVTALFASMRELHGQLTAIITASEGQELAEKYRNEPQLNAIVTELMSLPQSEQRQTVRVLRQIIASLPTATVQPGDNNSDFIVFTQAMPLYFENNPQPYPTHIHIHQQTGDKTEVNQPKQRDTWLRILTATQNLGIVELVFHLYGTKQLDIRVNFADTNGAQAFANILPEIRAKLTEKIEHGLSFNIIQAATNAHRGGKGDD